MLSAHILILKTKIGSLYGARLQKTLKVKIDYIDKKFEFLYTNTDMDKSIEQIAINICIKFLMNLIEN